MAPAVTKPRPRSLRSLRKRPVPLPAPPHNPAYPPLPTLRDIHTGPAPAAMRQRRRRPSPPPIPWYALIVPDAARFRRIRLGELFVVEICECAACARLIVEALRKQGARRGGCAHLVLLAPDERAMLVARGLDVLANNLRISAVWRVAKAASSLFTAAEATRARAGHLVRVSLPMPRAAAYLVGRLPVPESPIPLAAVEVPEPFVVYRNKAIGVSKTTSTTEQE